MTAPRNAAIAVLAARRRPCHHDAITLVLDNIDSFGVDGQAFVTCHELTIVAPAIDFQAIWPTLAWAR